MYGIYEKSYGAKVFFFISHVVAVLLAGWILFGSGGEEVSSWLGWKWKEGSLGRRVELFTFSAAYLARFGVTLFFFIKRKTALDEVFSVVFLFFLIHLSFSLLGGANPAPLGIWDFLAVLLYLIGSIFNSYSEYQRHVWKKRSENKGKIYTEGLFRYSMHINYFGDTLLFLGFALLTQSPWVFILPVVMTLGFIFFHIPMLGQYLLKRYGKDFQEYAKKTKKFIPYVY